MKKKNIYRVLMMFVLGAGFVFSMSISAAENASMRKAAAKSGVVEKDGVFRLKKFSYIDRQGIGGEAFSLLIPSDWDFQGGITWSLDNPGMPAVA